MLIIGSHVSFKAKKYLTGAVEEALSYQANAMMIYLGPPQNAKRVNVSVYNYEEYLKKYKTIIKPENIIVHAPYIINPANPEKAKFAEEFLIQEIERMNYIQAKYLVLHPGAYTKYGPEIGISTLVKTLKSVIQKTEKVEILIETMAGKGTEIGVGFEQLNKIFSLIDSPRVNLCFDTCHIWDSGIDLKNINQLIEQLKQFKLLEKIKVIHLNDSKNAIGSKKDRHANLNQGNIGIETLKTIIYNPAFKNVINILETPWIDGQPPYKNEIAALQEIK